MSGCIREEDNNRGNYCYCIGSHRLSSAINARFAQWFSLHTHPTTGIVKIPSLNLHSAEFNLYIKYSCLSSLHRFWQSTLTNRTHLILWFNHNGELAPGAFDGVDSGSFYFVRLQSATHLVLPLSSRCLWND